jgi:ankyrin repeat protein
VAGAEEIHTAVESGNIKKVKALIKSKHYNVYAKNTNGQTALHIAASKGNKEITLFLISQAASISPEDNEGRTPLHYAAEKGHKEIVTLLLSKGALVDSRDRYGKPPLALAIENGHKEVVELLIAGKADVNTKTLNDETLLEVAESSRNKDIARILMAHGARKKSVLPPILIYAGVIIAGIAEIWLLVVAFTKSILWGLAYLFIPFVKIIFWIMYIGDVKYPFLMLLGGIALCFAGASLGGP